MAKYTWNMQWLFITYVSLKSVVSTELSEVSCEIMNSLSWTTVTVITDAEESKLNHLQQCTTKLSIKMEVHVLSTCCKHPAAILWDPCRNRKNHILIDTSYQCLFSILNMIPQLENNCPGALLFSSRFLVYLQDQRSYELLNNLNAPLFHLVTVHANHGDVILRTLIRIGDKCRLQRIKHKTWTESELFPNIMCKLCGINLQVTTKQYSTCTIIEKGVNDTLNYSGAMITILDTLSKALNFSYSMRTPGDDEWGVYRNNSWTGMIGQLARKEVDIAAACLSITESRLTVVDFTEEVLSEDMVVLLPVLESAENKWKVYGEPFKVQVWIVILSSGLGGSLIIIIFSRIASSHLKLFGEPNVTYPAAVWYTFGAYFSQAGMLKVDYWSVRCFIGCLWLCCFIISITYSAKLVSFLASEKQGPMIASVEALGDQNELAIALPQGTATEHYFMSNASTADETLYAIKQITAVVEKAKLGQSVLDGGYAAIGLRGNFLKLLKQHQNLTVIPIHQLKSLSSIGIALQKNSYLKRLIDSRLRIFTELGLIQEWKKIHREKLQLIKTKMNVAAKHFKLRDCQGAFIIVAGILILAASVLLCEIVWKKFNLSFYYQI